MTTEWKYITRRTGFSNLVDVVCKVEGSTSRRSSRVRQALEEYDWTLRSFESLESRCVSAVCAEGTAGDAEEEGREWAGREADEAEEFFLTQRNDGTWTFDPKS